LIDVSSDFRDGMIPKGTRGTVVDRYQQPKEGYAIDLEIPDDFDGRVLLRERGAHARVVRSARSEHQPQVDGLIQASIPRHCSSDASFIRTDLRGADLSRADLRRYIDAQQDTEWLVIRTVDLWFVNGRGISDEQHRC
jgi:hypothetical protein